MNHSLSGLYVMIAAQLMFNFLRSPGEGGMKNLLRQGNGD